MIFHPAFSCFVFSRQKHGLDRDQMAGKIKCNQYIIASSSLPSSVSVDEDKTPLSPSDTAYSSPSTSTVGSTRCPTCLVDFFNYRGLQQHLQVSPRCRIGYLCLKCKVSSSLFSGFVKINDTLKKCCLVAYTVDVISYWLLQEI